MNPDEEVKTGEEGAAPEDMPVTDAPAADDAEDAPEGGEAAPAAGE